MYSHANAVSIQCCVSACSPSESDSLLTKCAIYRLLCQASARFAPIEREEFLFWKTFSYFKNLLLQRKCFLINLQISKTANLIIHGLFSLYILPLLQSLSSVLRPPSSVIRPLSSALCPPSSVIRLLSSVLRHPSSVIRPPSSVIRHPSSVLCLPFTPNSAQTGQ